MEIELKLALPATAVEALKLEPLLPRPRGQRKSVQKLDNVYFDTPDHQLAEARVGLRLRKQGRRWLQTVKSGGSSQSGLHQREEIEFPVSGKTLAWEPLAGTPFMAVLEPLRDRLTAQFRTLFTRDRRLLTGPSGAEIEAAIDQGDILAGKRHETICEIELELKSGPVDDVFDLALALVDRHPLVLDNRSKAERGDALARSTPLASPVKATEVSLPHGADVKTAVRHAIENCLAQWQANEPGFHAQAIGSEDDSRNDSEYLHQLRVGDPASARGRRRPCTHS